MQSTESAADIYRREARRLRTMAAAMTYKDVSDGLLDVACRYDAMADQADSINHHSFGQPFGAERRDRRR